MSNVATEKATRQSCDYWQISGGPNIAIHLRRRQQDMVSIIGFLRPGDGKR
jgi:hypothetical protein